MPSVLHALKLSVTLGASTAVCENSFSALENILRENRRAVVHSRKASDVTDGGQGCAPPPWQAKYKKCAPLLACISVFIILLVLIGF